MRVLILGGSGLISTEAARACLELGHETYAMTRGRQLFRVRVVGHRVLKVVTGDRANREEMQRILEEVNPEAIIDCICYKPQDMRDLLSVRNSALKQIVFVSTVCVLGGPLAEHPATAKTACRPISPYGVNKAEIEGIVREFHHSGVVAGTIFRPSSTDGPGAWLSGNLWGRDGLLFALLLAGRPVIVCAGGVLCQHGSSRDVGRALALSLGRETCYGKTYQVVGYECIAQAEFVRRTAQGIGARAPDIVEIPADWLCEKLKDWKHVGFVRDIWRFHGCFDITRLRRDIPDWHATMSVAHNARATWEWGRDSGKWSELNAGGVFHTDLEPEPLCEAYAKARSGFLGA